MRLDYYILQDVILKLNVMYKQLIRLEMYKLAKHVLGGDAECKPLVMWW